MDQLRKIIQETLSSVLEEDFNSINEIKELANKTLILAAQNNLRYVLKQIEEGVGRFHLHPVRLLEVYQNNPKNYPVLQEFITNVNVVVLFSFSKNSKAAGHYEWTDEKEYDKTRTKFITLFYDDSLVNDIKKKIEERQADGRKIESNDLYFSLWFEFASTLEHEIQHAYDDYRSSSKIFRAKKFDKYRQKYHTTSGAELPINDPKISSEKHIQYLKLQHEIGARFTQAINKTRFTDVDFAKSPEGIDYVSYKMKPLDKVLKTFPYEFTGWHLMSDKVKKSLIRKVSQYWHKIQDNLPEKNNQSLEKEKEALNKKQALAEIHKRAFVRNTLMNLEESKKKKLESDDEIHLPELTMKKKDLIKYLKELYNIELK